MIESVKPAGYDTSAPDTHTHAHTRTHTNTHAHTRTHTHTYIHTRGCAPRGDAGFVDTCQSLHTLTVRVACLDSDLAIFLFSPSHK